MGQIYKPDDETHYINSMYYPDITEYEGTSATVTGGKATLYLTKDGTSTGDPVFKSVMPSTMKAMVWSSTSAYIFNNPVVSGDMRSLTIDVYSMSNLLGILSYTAAAAGVTVYASVKGMAA